MIMKKAEDGNIYTGKSRGRGTTQEVNSINCTAFCKPNNLLKKKTGDAIKLHYVSLPHYRVQIIEPVRTYDYVKTEGG